MMLYISMKFHENILNGFQVIERTRLHDGWMDRQMDRQQKQQELQQAGHYTPVASNKM